MTTDLRRQVSVLALLAIAVSGSNQVVAQSAADATQPPTEAQEIHLDAQGRKYRIVEYPKGREGIDYVRLANGQIRVRFGMSLDIHEEGDTSLFVRVYLPDESGPPTSAPTREPAALDEPPDDLPTWPIVDHLEFLPFDSGLPRQGRWRDGFDIADMNGDGHLDIVFGPARKGRSQPNIFLGNGAGSWSPWQATYPRLPYDYGDAAAADFNKDGQMDLALAAHLRGIVVLVGDGSGSFRAWSDGIPLAGVNGQGGAGAFSLRAIEAGIL